MTEKTVRFSDAVWQQGFTPFPNVILLDGTLSSDARFIYGLLAHFARENESAWPGQLKLAELAKRSERQVRLAIRELETAGLVTTHRRGQGRTNRYVLH